MCVNLFHRLESEEDPEAIHLVRLLQRHDRIEEAKSVCHGCNRIYVLFVYLFVFFSQCGNMARSEIREKEGKILISKALVVPLALDFILRGQNIFIFF